MSPNDSHLLCDLSNLPHSIGNKNFQRFPVITDPVQCHDTVQPQVHGSWGHHSNASTSSSLATVVVHFEILDSLEVHVSSPLAKPVECSTTATVAAEHAVLLAPAKTCSCTPDILLMSLTTCF